MLRIDSLTPNTEVLLDLGYAEPEKATFVKIEGSGNDRRATFETPAVEGLELSQPAYEWEAYRYQGRWAFGSSADRLRLVGIV